MAEYNLEYSKYSECVICFENYTKDNPKRNLFCNKKVPHFMCNDCYNNMYIFNNNHCPLCRRDIVKNYLKLSENNDKNNNKENTNIVGNIDEPNLLKIFVINDQQIVPAICYAKTRLRREFGNFGHITISINFEKYNKNLSDDEIFYHFR